ncbi:MAG: hypothetical protein ACFE8U_08215 [Candidatus Hermodarchaeota archaeon]
MVSLFALLKTGTDLIICGLVPVTIAYFFFTAFQQLAIHLEDVQQPSINC